MANYYTYPVMRRKKYYYQYGNEIGIYPTPNEAKTLRIHYVREPLLLQRNADPSSTTHVSTPEIKQEYHEALALYATYKIMMRINPQLAAVWKQEYIEWYDKAIAGSKLSREEIIYTRYVEV